MKTIEIIYLVVINILAVVGIPFIALDVSNVFLTMDNKENSLIVLSIGAMLFLIASQNAINALIIGWREDRYEHNKYNR